MSNENEFTSLQDGKDCLSEQIHGVKNKKQTNIIDPIISDVKKGEAKKVQVSEWLKGVKSLWGQEEKIYQQGCVELQHTKQIK